MLIHSCIYYKLNDNYISDTQWNEWAYELEQLQSQYPTISEKVTLYEYFKDWDGSSGAFLPLDLPWVVKKAQDLLAYRENSKSIILPQKVVPKKKSAKKRLF